MSDANLENCVLGINERTELQRVNNNISITCQPLETKYFNIVYALIYSISITCQPLERKYFNIVYALIYSISITCQVLSTSRDEVLQHSIRTDLLSEQICLLFICAQVENIHSLLGLIQIIYHHILPIWLIDWTVMQDWTWLLIAIHLTVDVSTLFYCLLCMFWCLL